MKWPAFAVIVLLASAGCLAQQPKPTVESFVWQSRNSNLTDLSTEFGELYGTLRDAAAQGAVVDTYTYQGEMRRPLEAILRDERLVAGKYFPREARRYVCSLNPATCKQSSNGTIKWTNSASVPLRLPKLTFEPVIVHREYDKKSDDRIKSIVVTERGGCQTYDAACQKYVENLNRVPLAEIEGAYKGPVLVPTLSYRTKVTFLTPPSRTPAEQTIPKLLEMRPAIGRSIVPDTKIMMQGNGAAAPQEAEEGTRSRILDLISHPFARNAQIPKGTTLIGVLDTWMDRSHCDIASSIDVYEDDGVAPKGVKLEACGTRGVASPFFDHGTHVVGLLAGSQNGKSGPGINPNSRIYFLRINPDDMRSDNSAYISEVSKRLNGMYEKKRPEVVNLSFFYDFPPADAHDTFLLAIAANKTLTLFVASAGNKGQQLDAAGVCNLRPACAGVPNLITVAALDLSSTKPALDGSNFGSAVHIAAPGKSVLSTLSGNRIGAMSGTSQAAPLVAGAASLLIAKNSHLYPEQVKNRLIYTSDLYPALYSQLLGGRLNITRALNFEVAQLSLNSGSPVEGDVINLSSSVSLIDVDSKMPLRPLWSQIRRLKYEPTLGHYTMFWKDNGGRLNRSFVTFQGRAALLKLKSTSTVPQLKEYRGPDIRDYVAAIPVQSE